MKRRYFGTDGIRGRVGDHPVTPEFVLKLGWAAGRVLGGRPGSKVLIGKDTRISGYLLESALEAGLVAAGVNIRLLGPMPTPAIAYLTRTFHAAAGIVISASHNPFQDNGIKFFGPDGGKLSDELELAIEEQLDQPMQTVASGLLGKARRIDDAPGRYIEFCKSSIPLAFDLSGLHLVMDCANGAAYHTAPNVLRELGAEVTAMGVEPDGLNINREVGSTEPDALRRRVVAEGADAGIALDGDGDRVVMVDAAGDLVDGDDILYIIARGRQASGGLRGPVVGTVMTNLGLEIALTRHDIGLERTAVGDRYILERLASRDWVLGGEPSGHIICRDRTSTGDGTISALQVLAEMVRSGRPLAALHADVEKCPQILVNVDLGENAADAVMAAEPVRNAVRDVEAALGAEGRVLLRPSGTEPLIRVMVEGTDAAAVDRLAHQLAAEVRQFLAASPA
jgi:phosphoglucosamine mutase